MEYFLSFESMLKARKHNKKIRLDYYLVHAFAMYLKGSFTPKYLASLLEMKPSDVRAILNRSPVFFEENDLYKRRERLASEYRGCMEGVKDGNLVPVSFCDIEVKDVPVSEPVINLCIKVANTHGDFLTLVGMSLLLAVKEGVSTVEELQERLEATDIPLQPYLDQLVEKKVLARKEEDGQTLYRVGAVGGEIYRTMFKSRLSR